MLRRLITISAVAVFAIASLIAVGVFGYYSHKLQLDPVYDIAERADLAGRRALNMPTITEGLVDRIDTIYVRLRGKSWEMPNDDFLNGGALAAWGDDILAMHKSGRVHYLDEDKGLVLADVQPPDNGVAAYRTLAAEKYPNQQTRDGAIRFNDIEFVENEELRGFALSYTFVDAERECYGNRVAWADIDEASISDVSIAENDWRIVFESNPCLSFNTSGELIVSYMSGGRIAIQEPTKVYLGNGEFHLDGIYRPDIGIQEDDNDYGKTLEIDLITGESRHISKGHRNLQGVAVDADGRLWTTEHGMRGGDELNLIRDGEDYGWPAENLGTLYSGVAAPTEGRPGRHEIYEAPVYSWLPSAAVSSVSLIEGFHDTWDGDLMISSLKDRTLFRARIRDDRVVFLEEIPIGQRVRDVMSMTQGRLALWLDTNELVVFTVEETVDPLEGLEEKLVSDGMEMTLATEVVSVLEGCNECHSYEENIHGAGPSLHGVVGRRIGGTAFQNYSSELGGSSDNWDTDTLAAYIADPEAVFSETVMIGLGVGDEELAAGIAKGLELIVQPK